VRIEGLGSEGPLPCPTEWCLAAFLGNEIEEGQKDQSGYCVQIDLLLDACILQFTAGFADLTRRTALRGWDFGRRRKPETQEAKIAFMAAIRRVSYQMCEAFHYALAVGAIGGIVFTLWAQGHMIC